MCRMAVVSLVLSSLAVLAYISVILLSAAFPPPPGHHSPLLGQMGSVIMLLSLAGFFLWPVGLITGVRALRRIGESEGALRGKAFAWISVGVGGIFLALYLIVAIVVIYVFYR